MTSVLCRRETLTRLNKSTCLLVVNECKCVCMYACGRTCACGLRMNRCLNYEVCACLASSPVCIPIKSHAVKENLSRIVYFFLRRRYAQVGMRGNIKWFPCS